MSDFAECEGCGRLGKRRRFYPCPDDWYFMEVKIDGSECVIRFCSEACRDGLLQKGPGEEWVVEKVLDA